MDSEELRIIKLVITAPRSWIHVPQYLSDGATGPRARRMLVHVYIAQLISYLRSLVSCTF